MRGDDFAVFDDAADDFVGVLLKLQFIVSLHDEICLCEGWVTTWKMSMDSNTPSVLRMMNSSVLTLMSKEIMSGMQLR